MNGYVEFGVAVGGICVAGVGVIPEVVVVGMAVDVRNGVVQFSWNNEGWAINNLSRSQRCTYDMSVKLWSLENKELDDGTEETLEHEEYRWINLPSERTFRM